MAGVRVTEGWCTGLIAAWDEAEIAETFSHPASRRSVAFLGTTHKRTRGLGDGVGLLAAHAAWCRPS